MFKNSVWEAELQNIAQPVLIREPLHNAKMTICDFSCSCSIKCDLGLGFSFAKMCKKFFLMLFYFVSYLLRCSSFRSYWSESNPENFTYLNISDAGWVLLHAGIYNTGPNPCLPSFDRRCVMDFLIPKKSAVWLVNLNLWVLLPQANTQILRPRTLSRLTRIVLSTTKNAVPLWTL